MNPNARVLSLLRAVAILAAISFFHPSTALAADDINAVLGNVSWTATHDAPASSGSEAERIQTHLRHVAAMLKRASPDLTAAQYTARTESLRALLAYADAGVFPRRAAHDGYGIRRPRFIDDRGVHCAVGELIRLSGEPELAQAINRGWEFGFVSEIDSPRLASWAEDRGFTPRELAMIQPGYSAPPSKRSVVRDAQDARDSLTLQCAREHAPPSDIKLRFQGNTSGQVAVIAKGKDPFAACFARALQATGLGSGGAWDTEPQGFTAALKLTIPSPQDLIAARIKRLDLSGANSNCVPRPGPLVKEATIELTSETKGMTVDVKTEPANEEVTACLIERVQQSFADVGAGAWKVHVSATKPIGPVVTSARLQQVVRSYARNAAAKCHDDSAPPRLGVVVGADPGEKEFMIRLTGGSDDFQACVASDLRSRLRSDFASPRQLGPEKFEPDFRIDGIARFEATIDIERRGR